MACFFANHKFPRNLSIPGSSAKKKDPKYEKLSFEKLVFEEATSSKGSKFYLPISDFLSLGTFIGIFMNRLFDFKHLKNVKISFSIFCQF